MIKDWDRPLIGSGLGCLITHEKLVGQWLVQVGLRRFSGAPPGGLSRLLTIRETAQE